MKLDLSTDENTREEVNINDTSFNNINTDDMYEQIDLKIEKDDIINKDVFFGNHSTRRNPRKIGNTYAFFYDKDGEPLIVIGPHCIY